MCPLLLFFYCRCFANCLNPLHYHSSIIISCNLIVIHFHHYITYVNIFFHIIFFLSHQITYLLATMHIHTQKHIQMLHHIRAVVRAQCKRVQKTSILGLLLVAAKPVKAQFNQPTIILHRTLSITPS